MTAGTLIKYHQHYSDTPDYQSNLKLLQYDMLYGDKYIYGGVNPYERTNLQMGVNEIKVSNAYEKDGQIFIEGENFTKFSRVNLNGHHMDTTFINPSLLMVEDETLESGDIIIVEQVTVTNFVLSKTEEYISE